MKVMDGPFYFEGGDRGVILFHSFTSTPVDVRTVGRAISKQGYTVYGVQFTAHGQENYEDVLTVEPQTWFEDGKKAVDYMHEQGFDRLALLGVSLGGIVSIATFLEDDSVVGAGTMGSPMIAGFGSNTPKTFWKTYVAEKKEQGMSQEDIDNSRKSISHSVKEVMDFLDQKKLAMYPEFEKVTRPVFIAQGGSDELIEPEQAYSFRDALKNTDVSFHWYPEGPHVLPVSKYRKELVEDMTTFLDSLNWE